MVDAPSPKGKKMRTLTPAEVEVLLERARDNYYYPVIYTALNSGMRQAELLGLRWRDVDLNMLSISVAQVLYKRRGICEFKEPKTSHSRRRVAMTPKLGLYMREHLKAQQDLFNTMGRPHTEDALVFSTEGKPIDPTVLSHSFTRLARRSGLEGVRFHDLRHTFASLMLLLGAKPKVISEALGHASVAFTMDCYSHIISGMQEEAMALLDGVMPSGVIFKITSPNPSPN
jgi:integrase